MASLVGDNQAVADELGGGKAILVGRDWGAPIVWNSALADPKRFTAVAGMSIPHTAAAAADDRLRAQDVHRQRHLLLHGYFQDEGVAEKELEADVRGSIREFTTPGRRQRPAVAGRQEGGEGVLLGINDPGSSARGWRRELDYLF